MGVAYNSSIVTNGLVLCLDAGNRKSYPGSGATWTDLSGNGRNGTFNNMDGTNFNSANGGSLTFDGTNEFVQCSGSPLALTAATFIVWIRRNGNQDSFDGIMISRVAGQPVNGINFQSSNQLGYHWNSTISTYGWQSGLALPNLSWSMCVVSVTSSLATAYLYQASGLTTAVNTVSHTSTTLNSVTIGQDNESSRSFAGNISQSLIYNRALTAAEIQQNYLATKSRYF